MPPAFTAKSSKNKSTEQAQQHPAEVSRQPVPTGPHGAVLALQRSAGNHAVNHLLGSGFSALPSTGGAVLQRKCACDANTMAGGECEECSQKKRLGLQTKLKVNEPGDSYEQEADRIADQVMAAPAHHAVSGAPPRIQRFSGQPAGQVDTAPASVDQTLASPGRPLEPTLRQDMEQRFGHDFSRVRVHTDAAAEQSAQDVNAQAYTVGHHIVFGAGRFAPGAHDGRRLLAHELAHVVQQSGIHGVTVDQSDEKRGLSPICPEPNVIRRAPGDGPGQAGEDFKIVSDVWEVNGRPVVVVESGGERTAFYQRSSSDLKGRLEGHVGPQKGDWAPFQGFDKDGHFAKEIYYAGKLASDPRYGYGDAKNLRIAQSLKEQNLPKAQPRDWRDVQLRLQDLGVEVHTPIETPERESTTSAKEKETGKKKVKASTGEPSKGQEPVTGKERPKTSKGAKSKSEAKNIEGPETGKGESKIPTLEGKKQEPTGKKPAPAKKTTTTPPTKAASPKAVKPAAKTPKTSGSPTDTGGSKTQPKAPPSVGQQGKGDITTPPKVTPSSTGSGATRATKGAQAAYRKQVAKAIASSGHNATMAKEFTQRIQKYLAIWGALNHALGLLSTIDNMEDLLAHGTVLKDQQNEANNALKSGAEAMDQAEVTVEDISLFEWTVAIGEATRNEDEQSLFSLDEALGKISLPLEDSAKKLTEISNDLSQHADPLNDAMYQQLVGIVTPHQEGTYPNAEAFALYTSLERLHGTMMAAASNYATASQTLTSWAEQLRSLEASAEDAAWFFARKHARIRLEIEQAKQFRCEVPTLPEPETEKGKQAREAWERLTKPSQDPQKCYDNP